MFCKYLWILFCIHYLTPNICGQKYQCLMLNIHGIVSSQGYDSSSDSEDDEMTEEDDDDEEEEDEDDDEEEEDKKESAVGKFISETRRYRNRRQVPILISNRLTSQSPSLNWSQSEPLLPLVKLAAELSKSINNSATNLQIDDHMNEEKESAYEYDVTNTEYTEYNVADTSQLLAKTIRRNVTFIGKVRCPNPSQKLHFRKVVTGYSITGSCYDGNVACSKDITHFKQITGCEGEYGECNIEISTEMLDGCGLSNYVRIKYDCVYDHSLLDICSKADVSRWKEVTIISPSYPLPAPVLSTNIRTCECEISTDPRSYLSMSYLSSDMAGSDDKCDEEVLLFEQKYNALRNSTYQVTGELCGKKSDYRRRFGDNILRLTYLLGGVNKSRERGGFFAHITAESLISSSSLINVNCTSLESNAASIPKSGPILKTYPIHFRKTVLTPSIIKEEKRVSPPVRAPDVYYPPISNISGSVTNSNAKLPTTPMWRIGPRGRKYIPRPGHPHGPLFLDGLGSRGLRRRYQQGARRGMRRRLIRRTTMSPIADSPNVLADTLNDMLSVSTIHPVTMPTSAETTSQTIGAANNAGAVKAWMDNVSKEDTSNKAASAEGTLIAVIASMASVIVIIVSAGVYYFYRRHQHKQSARDTVTSTTSNSWYSDSYYGITNFFTRLRVGNPNAAIKQGKAKGHNYNNVDEPAYYESYGKDILSENKSKVFGRGILDPLSRSPIQTSGSVAQIEPIIITTYTQPTITVPENRPVLVAPPRKKRRRPVPPLPINENHYDNNTTQQATLQPDPDNYDVTRQPTLDTLYDNNCASSCQSDIPPLPINPIVEITEHENTEYASISEMKEMANSKC